jgi:hypothetical protein
MDVEMRKNVGVFYRGKKSSHDEHGILNAQSFV